MEAKCLLRTLLLMAVTINALPKTEVWQDDLMHPAGPHYGINETEINMELMKENPTHFNGNMNGSVRTLSVRNLSGYKYNGKLNNHVRRINKRGSHKSVMRQWYQPPQMYNPWRPPQSIFNLWFPVNQGMYNPWFWGQSQSQSQVIFRPWPGRWQWNDRIFSPGDDDREPPSESGMFGTQQRYLYGRCKALEEETIEITYQIDVYIEKYEEIGCKCKGKSCVCCYYFLRKLICHGTVVKGREGVINRLFIGDRVAFDQRIKSLDLNAIDSGKYDRYTCQALPNCLQSSVDVCMNVTFRAKSNTKSKTTTVTLGMILEFRLFWQFQLCVIEMPPTEFEVKNNNGDSRNEKVAVIIIITFEGGKKQEEPVKVMLVKKSTEEVTSVIAEIFEEEEKQRKANKAKGVKTKPPKHEKPTKIKNWEPANSTEVSFLAILYIVEIPAIVRADDDFAKSSPEAEKMAKAAKKSEAEDPEDLKEINFKVDVREGETCGGVLLSASEVLTLCSCVRYFYLSTKYYNNTPPDKSESKELERHPSVLYSKDIYITFANNSFRGDQSEYKLDPSTNNTLNTKCFDLIEEQLKSKKSLKSYKLETIQVVMGITPPIEQNITRPHMHNKSTVKEKLRSLESVNLISIGLQKKDGKQHFFSESGEEIEPHFEPIKSSYEKCDLKNCKTVISHQEITVTHQETVEGGKRTEKGSIETEQVVVGSGKDDDFDGYGGYSLRNLEEEEVECLCAPKDFQLCSGAPGFPLVADDGSIIGLSSTPVDCNGKGAIVVHHLDDDTVEWYSEEDQSVRVNEAARKDDPDKKQKPENTSRRLGTSSLLNALISGFALANMQ